jgi:hypothetical protein
MTNQDGQYDYTRPGQAVYDRPWQLTSEALSNARTWWNASPPWYPAVPATNNPQEMIPPRYGYRTEELTISDVLNGVSSRLDSSHARDSMMTDWSGQPGGYEATMRPTGPGGGGIT